MRALLLTAVDDAIMSKAAKFRQFLSSFLTFLAHAIDFFLCVDFKLTMSVTLECAFNEF
jgi:hypothetical protein